MFQRTTTKLPAWRELFDATLTAKAGMILSHDDISKVLKIPHNAQRYFQQVQRWRREEMTVRHRQWRTVRAIGYELQEPNQHRAVAAIHIARSRKATRRAHVTLAHTDMERLTDFEKMQHINAEARTGVLYQIAQATEKELRHLAASPVQPALNGKVPKPV